MSLYDPPEPLEPTPEEEEAYRQWQEQIWPSNTEILKLYREGVEQFVSGPNKGPFGWVDDALCRYSWYYWVHCEWVGDWNRQGRTIGMVEFLTNWLTLENIVKARQTFENYAKQGRLCGL